MVGTARLCLWSFSYLLYHQREVHGEQVGDVHGIAGDQIFTAGGHGVIVSVLLPTLK